MIDTKNLSLEEKRRLARELLQRKEPARAVPSAAEPIAIIGMACRYPGGAIDPDSYWRLLDAGVDATREIPPERWDADALYDPDPDALGKMTTRRGGFLEGVDQFDPGFFGLAPREAVHIDPQHRLLLETSHEALEQAGIPPHSLAGAPAGVFVGIMSHDYEAFRAGPLASINGHVLAGTAASIASGRISYVLGLQGPSLTVDTACSSSLVTLHLACQSLHAGECEVALAGGVTLVLTPELHVGFSRLHGLAADGRCKSFSAEADGVGWSEGCGLLVLKRLADARRDGDTVWGLIRGTAVNHDGRSNGLTAPNGPAQEAVIRRALAQAGLDPHEVDYIEGHGTGTRLGDPVEVNALAAVYCEGRPAGRPLLLGSAKSNLGHTQAAAGIAGVMKVLLALRHGRLPATLHAASLNPHVPWDQLPLRVLREATPWPPGGKPRIAGVSAFGISGTNAHALIAEPPPMAPPLGGEAPAGLAAHPILLSGHTPEALTAQAARLIARLKADPAPRLADVAHTLALHRTHWPHRAALTATSTAGLVEALEAACASGTLAADRPSGQIAFLCTGQGAQYAGMGRGLYASWPVFREALDTCARLLAPRLPRPLLELVFAAPGSADASLLTQTEFAQPAMFSIGWALAELWRSWGVTPQLLLGHSVGEYLAACLAGVFSLEEGLELIAARGRLMQTLCAPGAMLALRTTEDRVGTAIAAYRDRVSIATVNGPELIVIAGEEAAVVAIAAAFEQEGVRGQRLDVSHGFHSPLMQPMLEPFAAVAARIRYQRPKLPIVSNVTGQLAAEELASADYWVNHVLAPVRFAEGMQALYVAGARAFVELGPRPVLLGMGAACLPDGARAAWAPSLRKDRDDTASMLEGLGTLWSGGAEVDWRAVAGPAGGARIALPTYPFQRTRCWFDTRSDAHLVSIHAPGGANLEGLAPLPNKFYPHEGGAFKPARDLDETSAHPLLGARVPMAGVAAAYEKRLTHDSVSWLPDHKVFDTLVVPGAGIAEWVQAAADARFGTGTFTIAELLFQQALLVPDSGALRVQVQLTEDESERAETGGLRAVVYSQPAAEASEEWITNSLARLVPATTDPLPAPPAAAPPFEQDFNPETFYANFWQAGLQFGPAFRAVRSAWRAVDGAMMAEVALEEATAADAGRYGIHPALYDAVLQCVALDENAEGEGLYLPIALRDVTVGRRGATAARVRAVFDERTHEHMTGSVTAWDAEGACIVRIGRLECKYIKPDNFLRRAADADALLYGLQWRLLQPAPSPAPDQRGWWLAASGALPALGRALAARLQALGVAARTVSLDALPRDLKAHDAVVYFAPPPEHGDMAEAAETQALAGLRLLHTLLAGRASRLVCVTAGAQAVEPGETAAPEAAVLWGLGRAFIVEHPDYSPALIDVSDLDRSDDVELVLAELFTADGENEVAFRNGQRFGHRLERRTSAAAALSMPSDGAVLISGGLGALGLALAEHLVRAHGLRHVALLGRRPPGAQAAETIDRLRGEGARVEVLQADVADRASLAAALASLAAPLRGVVHAAGVGEVCLLQNQSAERFSGTLGAKIRGTWNLHSLTLDQPLEMFVLFSSIAAISPDPGQGSYAAANAFLDAFAWFRRGLNRAGISLNWGPWAGEGMMAQIAPAAREHMASGGMDLLEPATALQALDAALAQGGAQQAILALDLERRRRSFGAQTIPPLWRRLLHSRRFRAAPPGAGSQRARIAALSGAERAVELERLIRAEVARVLGLASVDQVPLDRSFMELGVDSLMAIDLRNRLRGALGLEFSATLVWDYPNVRALADHLLERLAAEPGTAVAPVYGEAPLHRESLNAPTLLRLHPEPSLAPIFGLGGFLGGSTYLKDLATELGPLQPFFSMSYPGLESDEPPLTRIPELAAHFLRHLAAACPHGPYVLAGHSFGGLIAYEMALQLAGQGESVLELILFDTWAKETVDAKNISDRLPDFEQLLAPFIEAGRVPANLSEYRPRFERIWQANREAFLAYEMRPFDGDVTLILPEEGMFGQAPGNIDEWRRYCPRLKLRRTAGNHATMLLPPHVRRTAHIIRGLLRELDQPLFERPGAPAPAAVRTPATHAQRWMWLLHRLAPHSARYHLYVQLHIQGPLDVSALERALAALIQRHDGLRTGFEEADGTVHAVAHPAAVFPLHRLDAAGLASEARAAAVKEFCHGLAHLPFDLSVAPLARGGLAALDDGHFLLAFCWHHSVMDGASCLLFVRDMLALYGAQAEGTPAVLPPLPWRHADFAEWERRHFTDERRAALRDYWRQALAGLPGLRLPADRVAPTPRTDAGDMVRFELPHELTRALKSLAQAEGCTLFTVLIAAFGALLHRYSGQEDFGLATVASTRDRPEAKDALGCFVNTLVLRLRFGGQPGVSALLRDTGERMLGALRHKDLPFDEIARLTPQTGAGTLTPACFILENFDFQNLDRTSINAWGLRWSPEFDTLAADVAGMAKFDLCLLMGEIDGTLRGELVYSTDVFEQATVTRMAGHFQTLLSGMAADPRTPVARLPWLTEAERRQILIDWNDTARARAPAARLHELFEAQAARTPAAVAVLHDGRTLGYGELDQRAEQLASHLRALGVGPEVRVGLCVERSFDLLVGILAILKAGGAYVPLDPAYPAQRLALMLSDSDCRLLLVSEVTAGVIADGLGPRRVRVDQDESWQPRTMAPPAPSSAHDLAYLIYTSGSTGLPKAVAIEHASAVELVRWAKDTYQPEDLDGVLASTSVCFDLSVFELFVPLAAGGRVILARDALELPALDATAGVRLVNTVPSAAAELLRMGGIPDSVRVINLAGERLLPALVDALYAGTQVRDVYDLYGPSEDTTYSTFIRREPGGPQTIGRPIHNTRAYVLDSWGMPVPVGVAGELYLAGAGLARGYLNRPELTAERFVGDPFSAEPGARLYRTGDLVRWRCDGTLELLGRLDHQVKLRGFRIELGEIEAALAAHPAVAACAAGVREEMGGNPRLVAWITPAGQAPSVSELRAHLAQTLPGFMTPQAFMFLDALPRTPNGKLDRQALPDPGLARPEAASYQAPQSPLEMAIASVWRQVLGLDRVGRDDHFFELGGHSLLATSAADLLSGHIGRTVHPTELFHHPVLKSLAEHLGDNTAPGGTQARQTAEAQNRAIRQLGRAFSGKGRA